MFSDVFERFENHIQSKTKKELTIFLILLLSLIFSIIYFLLLPPVLRIFSEQKEAYETLKLTYLKNLSHFEEISQKRQEKYSDNKNKTTDLLKNFKKASRDNYDLLALIGELNVALDLQSISDISNEKEDLFFCLQGKFENFMEWMRILEENYFVFIEDLHIFSKENTLVYQVHIKNLGNSL
ncbi:hypothetical protein BKH41_08030 [Helicobacter sp. 12S02232-10]|uniref:hypothetical protein n=1 Tax=Helicobacter sp. 12S02232-10 TaxID=1476197 RepID=UPI000BA621BC|nr:hypothetical protein [Helicobacter sp. 12S02232-10]PAF47219.1 hypothetical protein BKH41_08030 [Helicobacter sp. 12S02232-10]